MSTQKVLRAVWAATELPREDRQWCLDVVRELAKVRFDEQVAILRAVDVSPEDKVLARRRCEAINRAVAILEAIDL